MSITLFLSMMGLVQANYDLEKKEFTSFEKKSFMDFVKISGKDKKNN